MSVPTSSAHPRGSRQSWVKVRTAREPSLLPDFNWVFTGSAASGMWFLIAAALGFAAFVAFVLTCLLYLGIRGEERRRV